jgi:hypothetical protein
VKQDCPKEERETIFMSLKSDDEAEDFGKSTEKFTECVL